MKVTRTDVENIHNSMQLSLFGHVSSTEDRELAAYDAEARRELQRIFDTYSKCSPLAQLRAITEHFAIVLRAQGIRCEDEMMAGQ